MEIYLDTAKIEEIREAVKLGVIRGVTTNPSLMMKARRSDYRQVAQEICCLVQGPVSAEVTSEEAEGMVAEAENGRDFDAMHGGQGGSHPLGQGHSHLDVGQAPDA